MSLPLSLIHILKITINKPTEFEAVYLEVDAGVRYWDDARVNGEYDTNCEDLESPAAEPTIPCAEYVGEQHRVLPVSYTHLNRFLSANANNPL